MSGAIGKKLGPRKKPMEQPTPRVKKAFECGGPGNLLLDDALLKRLKSGSGAHPGKGRSASNTLRGESAPRSAFGCVNGEI